MKKLVCILNDSININDDSIDSLLICYLNFSSRSLFEKSYDEICDIKNNTNKEIFILFDALISQSKLYLAKQEFVKIKDIADKIFFSDIAIYMFAKEFNCLDKLVYYSPTLIVSKQEISIWKNLGINNIIISKESTYEDYLAILNEHKDINLGMLAFGYPQIYFSKRKMLTSFKNNYQLDYILDDKYRIKEKTRPYMQPIYEDENGTYIFTGDIFFPYKELNNLLNNGMTYFIVDPLFVEENDFVLKVNSAIKGDISFSDNNYSTFMLYRVAVNDYEK